MNGVCIAPTPSTNDSVVIATASVGGCVLLLFIVLCCTNKYCVKAKRSTDPFSDPNRPDEEDIRFAVRDAQCSFSGRILFAQLPCVVGMYDVGC
jgi:hypothetical protein